MPPQVAVSTGFVIDLYEQGCSKEQDILVTRTSHEVPVFSQGGLHVSLPSTVLAAVSVKTGLDYRTLQDAATGLWTVRTILANAGVDPASVWCGAYFYQEPASRTLGKLDEWLQRLLTGADYSLNFNGQRRKLCPFDVVSSMSDNFMLFESPAE
ncbi:MAG TPA: DUF6602 domain-containing protein, partial [Luteitalea sp.]|nr:DUF6602 domain-containing protein [Luteitalea sp.]